MDKQKVLQQIEALITSDGPEIPREVWLFHKDENIITAFVSDLPGADWPRAFRIRKRDGYDFVYYTIYCWKRQDGTGDVQYAEYRPLFGLHPAVRIFND